MRERTRGAASSERYPWLGVGAGDRLRASAGPVRARKVGGARGEAPLQEEPTAERPTERSTVRLVPTADWFERRAPQGRRSGRARASEGEQHAAMPNPFNEFFGVGASLRATGLAARKARMDADGGSREGRGSATLSLVILNWCGW